MLIRGSIQDRLWGKTLGALGRRRATGQLTIRSGADSYALVFDDGHVVAASAPGFATTVIGLALQQELLSVEQVAELERGPGIDPVAQLATIVPADQLLRLRRQAIAAAATRTFQLEQGDFTFDSEITLPVAAGTAMHVGGLIYHGVMGHLDDRRLDAAVRELGSTFRLRGDGIALADLQYFGFGEPELVMVRALGDGVALAQIDHLPATERRIAFATIYTLASIGALYCETPAQPPRLARGTFDPTPTPRPPAPVQPRTTTTPAIARTSSARIEPPAVSRTVTPPTDPRISEPRIEIRSRPAPRGTEPPTTPRLAPTEPEHLIAYRRGQAALRDERLDDAINELARAAELSPDPDYRCALAWARFCKAPNKAQIADSTRTILSQAVLKHERPVLPYYYLGMVERILGRTSHALSAFQQVLDLDPHHPQASTEVRFLTRNSGPIKR